MSLEYYVLLDKARLPELAAWQSAIDSLGLATMTLDQSVSVAVHNGYLPATLNGNASGFEFSLFPATSITTDYPGLKGMFPSRDTAAAFRFAGEMRECACAMIALAALVKCADAPWFDPQEGECFDLDAAIAEARAALRYLN